MTFPRVNPPGWTLEDTLTSAEMNQLDINVSQSADMNNGGEYTPAALLGIGGAGVALRSVLETDAQFTPRFGLENWKAPVALPGTTAVAGGDHDAVTERWFICGGGAGEIAHSADDGGTWTALVVGGAPILQDLAVDPGFNTAIAVGNSGTAARITDITLPVPTTATVALPGAPSTLFRARHGNNKLFICGVVGGGPYLADSADGGATWTQRAAPASFAGMTMRTLAVGAGGRAVATALGGHNRIAYTANAGLTWSDSNPVASSIYMVVYDTTRGLFFAVSMVAGGDVYHSADGQQWSLDSTGVHTALLSPLVIGGNGRGLAMYGRAMAVIGRTPLGAVGRVIQSFDGGVTWSAAGSMGQNTSFSINLVGDRTGKMLLAPSGAGNTSVRASMRRVR